MISFSNLAERSSTQCAQCVSTIAIKLERFFCNCFAFSAMVLLCKACRFRARGDGSCKNERCKEFRPRRSGAHWLAKRTLATESKDASASGPAVSAASSASTARTRKQDGEAASASNDADRDAVNAVWTSSDAALAQPLAQNLGECLKTSGPPVSGASSASIARKRKHGQDAASASNDAASAQPLAQTTRFRVWRKVGERPKIYTVLAWVLHDLLRCCSIGTCIEICQCSRSFYSSRNYLNKRKAESKRNIRIIMAQRLIAASGASGMQEISESRLLRTLACAWEWLEKCARIWADEELLALVLLRIAIKFEISDEQQQKACLEFLGGGKKASPSMRCLECRLVSAYSSPGEPLAAIVGADPSAEARPSDETSQDPPIPINSRFDYLYRLGYNDFFVAAVLSDIRTDKLAEQRGQEVAPTFDKAVSFLATTSKAASASGPAVSAASSASVELQTSKLAKQRG